MNQKLISKNILQYIIKIQAKNKKSRSKAEAEVLVRINKNKEDQSKNIINIKILTIENIELNIYICKLDKTNHNIFLYRGI